jgi:hypothetical protein
MPWAGTLKVAAWFVAGMTLLVGVPGAGLEYTTFGTFAAEVGMFFVVMTLLASYGVLVFTFIWTTSDVPGRWANFKRFWREFPANWCRFWRTVGAVLYWLLMLPMTIGRLGDRFLRWLASRPAAWRAMPARDKYAALMTSALMFVMGVVAYQYWALASRCASALPVWLHDGDTLIPTLFIDAFLSMFTVVFGFALLSLAFGVARDILRRR